MDFSHFYDFYLCWQLMERDGDWKLLSFVRFDWLGPSSDTATFFFYHHPIVPNLFTHNGWDLDQLDFETWLMEWHEIWEIVWTNWDSFRMQIMQILLG